MIKLRNIITKFIGLITILFILFGGAIIMKIGYIAYFVIMLALAMIIAFGYYLERKQSKIPKEQQ